MTRGSSTTPSLMEAANAARRWLFQDAAPLWASRGRHSNGLFCEALSMDGDVIAAPTRLRVQARQLYAFCEIGRLGWSGIWRESVEQGVEVLVQQGRRDDGFFIHSFATDGTPLDLRADLYDHAFALFALAHAADVLRQPNLLNIAEATMDLIEAQWRSPYGGFLEGEIDGPPRRQNPHMHMLEACLALWSVSGSDRWKNLIIEIVSLCEEKFIDSKTGALTEYFVEDWSRLPSEDGNWVEPGHCLEWAWLFERLTVLGVWNGTGSSDGLVKFARQLGIDCGRGVAINVITRNGQIENPHARLWPQTERLKAALARLRRLDVPSEALEAETAFGGLCNYLDTPLKGLWRDVWSVDGSWVEQPAPASSFYHIVCGLSELIGSA